MKLTRVSAGKGKRPERSRGRKNRGEEEGRITEKRSMKEEEKEEKGRR